MERRKKTDSCRNFFSGRLIPDLRSSSHMNARAWEETIANLRVCVGWLSSHGLHVRKWRWQLSALQDCYFPIFHGSGESNSRWISGSVKLKHLQQWWRMFNKSFMVCRCLYSDWERKWRHKVFKNSKWIDERKRSRLGYMRWLHQPSCVYTLKERTDDATLRSMSTAPCVQLWNCCAQYCTQWCRSNTESNNCTA